MVSNNEIKDKQRQVREWMKHNRRRVAFWSLRKPDLSDDICQDPYFGILVLFESMRNKQNVFQTFWEKNLSNIFERTLFTSEMDKEIALNLILERYGLVSEKYWIGHPSNNLCTLDNIWVLSIPMDMNPKSTYVKGLHILYRAYSLGNTLFYKAITARNAEDDIYSSFATGGDYINLRNIVWSAANSNIPSVVEAVVNFILCSPVSLGETLHVFSDMELADSFFKLGDDLTFKARIISKYTNAPLNQLVTISYLDINMPFAELYSIACNLDISNIDGLELPQLN